MVHVRSFISSVCVVLALASLGCSSTSEDPIIEPPLAGATGGTAGISGGTGAFGGATGGATGIGSSGGLGGMTGGTAGAATGGVGGIGGIGGVAGMTDGMAGAGGTGGTGGTGGVGGAGGMVGQTDAIPCEVDIVVAQACHRCHSAMPIGGAPIALVTLADFQRDYVAITTKPLIGQPFKVYELARIRINRELGTSLMPQGRPLSADDMTTLNTWLVNGAPGGAACASP